MLIGATVEGNEDLVGFQPWIPLPCLDRASERPQSKSLEVLFLRPATVGTSGVKAVLGFTIEEARQLKLHRHTCPHDRMRAGGPALSHHSRRVLAPEPVIDQLFHERLHLLATLSSKQHVHLGKRLLR